MGDSREEPGEMQRLKDDFRVFLWLIWKHLGLPEPTPVQYDMALYLQHGPKRSIVEAFRGVGKSFVTSAFVVWLLYRNPQLKVMVVSASKERADAFSSFTKKLISEVPVLQHLQAKAGQRDSAIAFDVGPATADHSPSIKSVGITGQLTGSRADVIIADDVEVPGNSATQTQRDKLSELVKEFDSILKPLKASRIIYLGTPQCEMSLYNTLGERGYETRIWPAQYPDAKRREAYGNKLAPFVSKMLDSGQRKAGQATDPLRFTLEDLQERQVSYGRAGYALQFMLDTTLSDALKYPLRLSDLVVMSLDPILGPAKVAWGTSPELGYNDLPNVGFTGDRYYRPMWVSPLMEAYSGTVMAIDPSGRGADEASYAVVKMLFGRLFLVDSGGFPGGYDEQTLQAMAAVAASHKVNEVIVEANFGDGMFTQLLKPVLVKVHKCAVTEVRHNQQKEKRIIDTLEPVLMQHKLVVDPSVIRRDWETASEPDVSLFHQMTRITRERGALRHDDRLDALAIAVAYWVEQMAQLDDNRIEALKEREVDEELRKFVRNCEFPALPQDLVDKAKSKNNRGLGRGRHTPGLGRQGRHSAKKSSSGSFTLRFK